MKSTGRFLLGKIFGLFLLSACFIHAPLTAAHEPGEVWRYSPEKLRPFWNSRTMFDESVLFVKKAPDELPRASLLFVPTRMLSIRNASGSVTYKEGVDYLWKKGSREIVLPAGSSILFKTPQELRRPPGSQPFRLPHRDGNGEILFGGGHEYHDMQAVVAYKHKSGKWPVPTPAFDKAKLPRTIEKLKTKQPLAIALLGDSISTGCNASGWAKAAPFQPPYQELLLLNLKAAYGGPVTLTNFSVGGMDSAWGLANIGKVAAARPDLVILAFGMNDSGGRPAKDYQDKIKGMIDAMAGENPETEFILIATMLGNRDWTTLRHDLFPAYRDALAELCRPGVALADMTSTWDAFLQKKQDWDLTGNGVNHPNDFGHRVYAQVLSALLIRRFP